MVRHYLTREESGETTGAAANEAVRCKKAITDASEHYEQLRRPHVEAILQRAKQTQGSKRTMSWVEEYVMYGFMWVMGESSPAVFNWSMSKWYMWLGFFPSFIDGPLKAEYNYNVKLHVEQSLQNKKWSFSCVPFISIDNGMVRKIL